MTAGTGTMSYNCVLTLYECDMNESLDTYEENVDIPDNFD